MRTIGKCFRCGPSESSICVCQKKNPKPWRKRKRYQASSPTKFFVSSTCSDPTTLELCHSRQVSKQMKGWEHNRLMSSFRLFYFFCSKLLQFLCEWCINQRKTFGQHSLNEMKAPCKNWSSLEQKIKLDIRRLCSQPFKHYYSSFFELIFRCFSSVHMKLYTEIMKQNQYENSTY